MYPYLEPRELILKLHPDPLEDLSPETIAADQQFWTDQEAKLWATPGFEGNADARKMFAKLRSAIGGVYEYRKLDADAEAAYRQAIRLCPTSAEANFRLAKMLADRQRLDESIQVLETFLAAAPTDQDARGKKYLAKLNEIRDHNENLDGADKPLPGSQAFEE